MSKNGHQQKLSSIHIKKHVLVKKIKPHQKKIPEDDLIKSVPPSPPKLIRTVSKIREVIDTAPNRITPEMMKEYRNNMRTERIKMRSDVMKSLFTNSI